MVEKRGSNGTSKKMEKQFVPREILVGQWREAPEGIFRYQGGTATDSQGIPYQYCEGVRLWIGDEKEVMDSCQRPWAVETVNKAFAALGNKQNVSVLERGFGIGLVAVEIMDHLRRRGGSYTAIELNRNVADFARTTWTKKQNQIDKAKATSEIGGKFSGSNVTIEIVEGDSVTETEKMAKLGRRFDIIISDTFPLRKEERSINDLLDLATLIRCLNPDGVFAFFGYHADYLGGMNEKQRNLVEKYFEGVSRTVVKGINPPPDYKYFNPVNGSTVRELPVIICTKPRIQTVA